MTVDTSAVLAVMQNEVERSEFVRLIDEADRRLISTVSVLEAAMVLEGRRGEDAGRDLDLFLRRASITTVNFDAEQLAVARFAFRRYGKGRHGHDEPRRESNSRYDLHAHRHQSERQHPAEHPDPGRRRTRD